MKDSNNGQIAADWGTTRILIVDDHPLVRMSLKDVIQRERDLMVCGEAEDREQALAAVAASNPHLAIIDLTLKSSDGMELIKDLRDRFPKVQILGAVHARRNVARGAGGPRGRARLHHQTGGDHQNYGGHPAGA